MLVVLLAGKVGPKRVSRRVGGLPFGADVTGYPRRLVTHHSRARRWGLYRAKTRCKVFDQESPD